MQTVQTQPAKHGLISSSFTFSSSPIAHYIPTMPPPRIMSSILRARPQSQAQCLRRVAASRFASTTSPGPDPSKPVVPWKTPTSVWSPENLIPPPKDGEILLERRPNRALPPYVYHISITIWKMHVLTTIPVSRLSYPHKSSKPSPYSSSPW
jgi:hypothetical protein